MNSADLPRREPPPELARYSRQMLLPQIGEAGQKRLKHASVTLIGCGALGSVLAGTLVRAGVGYLRLVDRDFIELNNLQRQVLFDEHDIAQNLPKAEAAARNLRRVNSAVELEAVVADVNHTNIESLCVDADLLLDGTDNFETRFLINDVAVKSQTPWVYGACIGVEGLVMPIIPGETPCLRCIWEEAPPPGMTPTCDTAGVLGPVVNLVASYQAIEALKILTGQLDALCRGLLSIDGWTQRTRSLDMQSARDQGNCPCCKQGIYEYVSGARSSAGVALCGRNAVQLLPPPGIRIDFQLIADRLGPRARPTLNQYLLKFSIDAYQITLFPDGRAIIQGTHDTAVARSVYTKYVGG